MLVTPSSRLLALLCTAVGWLLACGNPAPPVMSGPPLPPAPATVAQPPVPDIVSEGNTTVTVLERPSADPMVPPPETVAPKVVTHEACRQQPDCAAKGMCSSTGNQCVALSYADCRWSPKCATGKCRWEEYSCISADCAKSTGCEQRGACSEQQGRCVIGDAAGCAGSAACTGAGLCGFADGRCVGVEARHCAAALDCHGKGLCSLVDGRCVAARNSDCSRSKICKTEKACRAVGGSCIERCDNSEACREFGTCTMRPAAAGRAAACIARTESQCEASAICKERGYCSVGMSGRCEAADDVDCRRSRKCIEEGQCSARRGRCIVANDAECAQASVACKVEGRCQAQAGRCVQRGR